jgi:NhaA family Na+:H+ antiporter
VGEGWAETDDETPVRHRWSESARFIPRVVVQPIQRFMDTSAAGALVMLGAAVLALVWVNSSFGPVYQELWDTRVQLGVGGLDALDGMTLRDWVNDGAMAFFFFVVALEIKRELVSGELRDPRAAALPVLAALGGMVVPALIFLGVNAGEPTEGGWGIPMATDIAFAVAVVTAAGRRVPSGARVFLLSLAIVDDLGAIIVIAAFYTKHLSLFWLLGAVAAAVTAWVLQRIHVRAVLPFALLALLCWFCLHESGVHPTLAGVAFGLLTPAWSFYDPGRFVGSAERLLDSVREVFRDEVMSHEEYDVTRSAVRDMRRLAVDTEAPLDHFETLMTPWVTFLVVPVFAFANAGLDLPPDAVTAWLHDDVALGVVLGLLVGKTVGVAGAAWLATRLRVAVLPSGTSWRHMLGVAMSAGVGFTVALFVTELAFSGPGPTESAKLGIFVGSTLSGIAGYLLLRTGRPVADPAG